MVDKDKMIKNVPESVVFKFYIKSVDYTCHTIDKTVNKYFFKTDNMGCGVSLYIFEFQVASKTLPYSMMY